MNFQAPKNEPYALCDQLDFFLSDRGRSLFPENLSLERLYHADPLVRADRELLQRALFVMLSSLFTTRSAETGGTVKITVTPDGGNARVSLSYEPASVSVPVAIPDTDDLAAAVDLLTRCDGVLSFSGRSGNTSRIVFLLPICGFDSEEIEGAETELQVEPLPFSHVSSMSVLIADDDAPIRELLGTIISSAGVQKIDYARNGDEACLKAQEKKYDLIFMDIAMPVMSGTEAFVRITARDPGIRIVFITGLYPDENIPEVADDLDSFGYIRKPFSMAQVRAILEKVLSV